MSNRWQKFFVEHNAADPSKNTQGPMNDFRQSNRNARNTASGNARDELAELEFDDNPYDPNDTPAEAADEENKQRHAP
jgi:hypothetical protein